MTKDLVYTRFFTEHGVMEFDAPHPAYLERIEHLRGSLAGLTDEVRDDRYREILVRAKTYLLGHIVNETVFGQAAAVIHELVARQPGFNAETSWYFMGVDTGEDLRFNAFGKHEKNQFDFHCQNLKKILVPAKKRKSR